MQSKRSKQEQFIGTDVGGTKIAVGLVDSQGNILATYRQPTDISSPAATLDGIAKAVTSFVECNHLDLENFDALGFGIPGLVDAGQGIGIASVNLGWENIPVRSELENRLGVRCRIDNDVRAGALGEARFGIARGLKNLVYVNIGTGISAVILLDGSFLMGTHGVAGEIGHAVLVPDGPECKCGGRGCFEAIASGPGIAERALEKIKAGAESILAPDPFNLSTPLTAEKVFEAAENGDPVSIETLREIGTLTAYALEYLALAYDPDVIVLGGSVGLGSPFLYQVTQQKLQECAEQSWVFAKAYSKDLVKLSALGNHAGILGAAALVPQR